MHRAVSGLLFSFLTAAAFDSTLLRYAPPDAGVLVGVNLKQLKTTEFGRSALAQMQARQPSGVKLPDFEEILVALPLQKQSKTPRGLLLLSGPCDRAQALALAKQARGGRSTEVAVECLGPGLLALGDPASVKAAVVRTGGADPVLVAKALEMAAENDVWIVTSPALAEFAAELPVAAGKPGAFGGELMKSLRQVSAGIRFGPTLLLAANLGVRNANDASALAGALTMLSGMAAQQEGASALAPVLQQIQIRPEGNSVKLSLAIAQSELERAFKSAVEGFMRQAVKAPPAQPTDTGIVIHSSPSDMGTIKIEGSKPQ